ncbi:MAG: UvrD-helicase domain-containing protein, partial [Christensenellaceae bacterium]|nr:UvrD-helicase domain-containing protein [Christensenellaceae bacterium]
MMNGMALRRALLEKEYGFLNQQQRQAVFQIEGPLLVLAGAGSGKTSVLTNRIAYMLRYGNAYHAEADPDFSPEQLQHLESCLQAGLDEQARALIAERPVSPYEVLAITFTNKAAREMRERLERLAGEGASKVWVSTFHSACCRILRRDIEKIGYSRSFTIYDDEDQLGVIKESLKALNLSDKDFAPREIRSRISGAKTLMQTPQEFMQAADDFRGRKIAEVYAAYEERLQKINAL